MGHENQHHHHAAVDDLQNLLTKANNDLSVVQHRLEKEFQNTYPDNVNPSKLVSRIKKIQDDLSSLKEQCRELLAAKQIYGQIAHWKMLFFNYEDLIDEARTTLVGNRSLLQRMQASSGLPITSDSDDLAYTNLNQVIDEWTVQIRPKTGDEEHFSDSEDINQLLFSAIVQNS